VTEHGLGFGLRVDVSGVERRDANIECRTHTRCRLFFFDLAAVRQPVAVGECTDFEAAAAEMTKLHALEPIRRLVGGPLPTAGGTEGALHCG
jgi:hypothetical protein